MQTGSGAAATACTRFLGDKMAAQGIHARFALGGITGSLVDLHEKGLIETLLDTQCFDSQAAGSLARNPQHIEISTNVYANPASKGASCDQLDVVILSALEIDLDFNVNVITGSDGVMRGASGGHCDVAAAANLTIVVAPLIRTRIPTVVKRVTTRVTPEKASIFWSLTMGLPSTLPARISASALLMREWLSCPLMISGSAHY